MAQDANHHRLLTAQEMATRLGVTRLTVYRILQRAPHIAKRIGPRGQWRFDPAVVEAWLDENAAGTRLRQARRRRGRPRGSKKRVANGAEVTT